MRSGRQNCQRNIYLEELRTGVPDLAELQEAGSHHQVLHVGSGYGDPACVGEVYQRLGRGGVDAVHGDVGLPALCHVVGEHGSEVGNVGGQNDPVTLQSVVPHNDVDIAQLPLPPDVLHHGEALVEQVFLVENCRLGTV